MMKRGTLLFMLTALAVCTAAVQAADRTHRLYDGITLFVHNPEGKGFEVSVDVRDINRFSRGPNEMLVKVYPPDGRPVVREVIPDDGIVEGSYGPPVAGWDQEAWYYATTYSRGMEPAQRWSSSSVPSRLAAVPKRTFKWKVAGGQKGIYRVLLVGNPDFYVTPRLSPALSWGVAGSPEWLHGRGGMFRKSYFCIPRNGLGLYFLFLQMDKPARRTFRVRDHTGKVLIEGNASEGLVRQHVTFENPTEYHDKVFTVEVGEGEGDFLMNLTVQPDVRHAPWRRPSGVTAVLCDDAETAAATQGGAIYHDGKVFWQMYQVRYYEFIKTIKPEDMKLPANLPKLPNYHSVGSHERPKADSADVIMHSYAAHKDPRALNAALSEMMHGLWVIGPNDHVALFPLCNLAYEMGTYAFFYHRPAWRIIQQTNAPDEAKAILREFAIQIGDRLAFSRGMALINGNALASLVQGLRYDYEATGDPLQKKLFESYWHRFTTGGFGERVGIGPSGGLQESFGYDYHYGTYVLRGWRAVMQDLKDERFIKAYDRMLNLYSHIYSPQTPAAPWCSRTFIRLPGGTYDPWDPKFRWKGFGGPDFTTGVNGHNEWFAARRRDYYAVTYHGRLSPTWLGEGFKGQIGYGGGALCQLHIPNKGDVIESTLNGSYGQGMHLSQWRDFHLHSVVGTTADGAPLVTANSEHFNARLEGTTVSSSADVRQSSVHVRRSYTFNPDHIVCSVQLSESGANRVFGIWGGKPWFRGAVTEAYEMIPYVDNYPTRRRPKPRKTTTLTAVDVAGKPLGELTEKPVEAAAVVIDRKGYGARVDLDRPRPVLLGRNCTLLIQLASGGRTPADEIKLEYRLTPYVGDPDDARRPAALQPETLPVLIDVPALDKLSDALAKLKPYDVAAGDRQVAQLRFAPAGDFLALHAVVTDPKVRQAQVLWKGSCVEVFGSMPGQKKIGQVMLAPGDGVKKAAAARPGEKGLAPAPDIRLQSRLKKTGYEISALIPLHLLAVDPAADAITLEFQIDVPASAKAKKYIHPTLFGSKLAYLHNVRYGVFKIEKQE